MQLVAADIGNSSIKIAVEHAGPDQRWCMDKVIRGDDPIDLNFAQLDISQNQPVFWAVSSVNKQKQENLEGWVRKHRPQDRFHLIVPSEVGLKTNVDSRERLGRDRLLAAWQALQLNESGPVIVVDAGTAVTVDLVDENQVFQGGLIFPGAHACLKVLARQTDALPDLTLRFPLVERDLDTFSSAHFPGKSTESAVLLGIYHNQISTIGATIEKLSQIVPSTPAVYLTGGGIEALINGLPESWEFVPDLVLQGALDIGQRLSESNRID